MRSTLARCGSLMLLGLPLAAHAQQSPSFEMERVSVTATATSMRSASWDGAATVGQESPTGAASSCNDGFLAGFGLWSVRGDLPVSTELVIAKNADDPTAIDLSWSGADEVFEVYRSSSPDNVLDPGHLVFVTRGCTFTDAPGVATDRSFYRIVGTSD